MKFAQLGAHVLADELQKLRKKMCDPDRINIYDQTYLDCLIEAEKTLQRKKIDSDYFEES
jgi:hypothetical protein